MRPGGAKFSKGVVVGWQQAEQPDRTLTDTGRRRLERVAARRCSLDDLRRLSDFIRIKTGQKS